MLTPSFGYRPTLKDQEKKTRPCRQGEEAYSTAAAISLLQDEQDCRHGTPTMTWTSDTTQRLEPVDTYLSIFLLPLSSMTVSVSAFLKMLVSFELIPFVFHPMLIVKEIWAIRIQLYGHIIIAVENHG